MLPIESADTRRLARAATLQVRPLGNGRFDVLSGLKSYRVVFTNGGGVLHTFCPCVDFAVGEGLRACKHVLAVALTQATDEDRAAIAHLLGIE
jgi:predicted nucleic acid-binding Zn finger protein